ncbi:MAG: hypothetical protein M3164_04755 [Actinomycetota bacterium]|nr:hypothetical protein [Actinomycetota bacterium]
MIIDCQQCEMQHTQHCDDCFVMAVLNRSQGQPLVIDPQQEPAITRLQDAGLAPVLKFKKKVV